MEKLKKLQEEKQKFLKKQSEQEKVRNTWTPNDIIVYSDYAELYLRNNKQLLVGIVKIDIDDVDNLKDYKWHITRRGYCEGRVCSNNIKMHRFLLNAQKGQIIDHINRDKLDNRKHNLRFVTPKENSLNTTKQESQLLYFCDLKSGKTVSDKVHEKKGGNNES